MVRVATITPSPIASINERGVFCETDDQAVRAPGCPHGSTWGATEVPGAATGANAESRWPYRGDSRTAPVPVGGRRSHRGPPDRLSAPARTRSERHVRPEGDRSTEQFGQLGSVLDRTLQRLAHRVARYPVAEDIQHVQSMRRVCRRNGCNVRSHCRLPRTLAANDATVPRNSVARLHG